GISVEENSFLLALDPKTGKEVWRRDTGRNARNYSGLLTTAGHLLFGGDAYGNLFALDPATGKALWHTRPGGNLTDGPMTFERNGKQYVVFGVADTLYTFTLPR
ncbi:MAG: PQQ-binding-like beta-propeller repeat protein, partial [Terriglobus sp.]